MVICPMCRNQVKKLKSNCHVIPRAFVKLTKREGRNVELDFKNNSISISQKDDAGDFWCESCEAESALLDGYAASVLLYRKEGHFKKLQLKTNVLIVVSGLNYTNLKKFVISIVIRDYLNKKRSKMETLFSKEIFRKLKKEYFGHSDEMLIVGSFLSDNDIMSRTIFSPVRNKSKDGVNFQLLNFGLQLYFKTRGDVVGVALQRNGVMNMLEIGFEDHGSFANLDEAYYNIVSDKKNNVQLQRVRNKYPNTL